MSNAALNTQHMPRDVVVWNRLSRAWIAALLLPVLALGAYALRMPSGPVRSLDDAAVGAPRAPALRDVLVAELERNPRNGRAWVLLARLETSADRHAEAATDYAKAVAASTKVAADPAVWCEYADAVAMAQGGLLAGQPRDLVMHALTLDARHPKALEMAGGVAFEARDYAAAAKYWRELLAQIPDTTREHRELAIAIARADELAGRR